VRLRASPDPDTGKNESDLNAVKAKHKKIAFFGHFGAGNLGNESTLRAMLFHLRRFLPDADVACICTDPEVVAANHEVGSIPIKTMIGRERNIRNPLLRLLRNVLIGIPRELWRWVMVFNTLKGTNMLIVPGTGLLTDAYGLCGWGPYSLFKWSLMAKLRCSKLLFVSAGAGPIYGTLGKSLIKATLSLADFRSYRDKASLEYVKGIGLHADEDRVYPDLVFSLPETVIPKEDSKHRRRPVVGIGLMVYAGRYSVAVPNEEIYLAYLENLTLFVKWLLDHEYDIRLLIGDDYDKPVVHEFKSLLKRRLNAFDEARILDEPPVSVEQILSQLAATDVVVATRFHNVLLALLLSKPVISISFHHKCSSLMSEMGLSEYCLDINHLRAERLIQRFCELETNAEKLRPIIKGRTEKCRAALDEQYRFIFSGVGAQ
jgi:polysaccharide pyruvyl transferase WcaK-like protein